MTGSGRAKNGKWDSVFGIGPGQCRGRSLTCSHLAAIRTAAGYWRL